MHKADSRHKVLVSSIPKSGTHLVRKCLELMLREKETAFSDSWKNTVRLIGSKNEKVVYAGKKYTTSFMVSHVPYSDYVSNIINENKYRGIFIYRDPRDVVVSLAFWMEVEPQEWGVFPEMKFNERVTGIITKEFQPHLFDTKVENICEYYGQFIPWLKDESFYSVKFEDLIGANGGGSLDVQKKIVLDIARHIEFECSDNTINYIVDNLFGNTKTFRAGKIGGWKKHFTSEHKKQFKEVAGQLLIDLGYEKDLNW